MRPALPSWCRGGARTVCPPMPGTPCSPCSWPGEAGGPAPPCPGLRAGLAVSSVGGYGRRLGPVCLSACVLRLRGVPLARRASGGHGTPPRATPRRYEPSTRRGPHRSAPYSGPAGRAEPSRAEAGRLSGPRRPYRRGLSPAEAARGGARRGGPHQRSRETLRAECAASAEVDTCRARTTQPAGSPWSTLDPHRGRRPARLRCARSITRQSAWQAVQAVQAGGWGPVGRTGPAARLALGAPGAIPAMCSQSRLVFTEGSRPAPCGRATKVAVRGPRDRAVLRNSAARRAVLLLLLSCRAAAMPPCSNNARSLLEST